jgi:hypothetical protein
MNSDSLASQNEAPSAAMVDAQRPTSERNTHLAASPAPSLSNVTCPVECALLVCHSRAAAR